jgi:hypothetical protein
MARVKFIEFKPGMEQLLRSPQGAIGKDLRKRGLRVQAGAKAQVGVRTGALRASIHMRHMSDTRGQYVRVGSNLNYALAHHEGTSPHIIKPNRKHMLKFQTKGQIVFAHVVKHPGTKPNRYLTDNLRLAG